MKKLLHSRNTGLIVVLILLLVMARILTPNMFSVQAIICPRSCGSRQGAP